jgi:hypothetical protein
MEMLEMQSDAVAVERDIVLVGEDEKGKTQIRCGTTWHSGRIH